MRDEIVFGSYDPSRYLGGVVRVRVPYDTIIKLVNHNFVDLNDAQNCSPSAQEFIEICESNKKNVDFEIYLVEHTRDDYRVTIEGVIETVPFNFQDMLCEHISEFRFADEFTLKRSDKGFFLRAWWD